MRVYTVLDFVGVNWRGRHQVYVSQAFAGERLGSEQADDAMWHVFLGEYRLGTYNERLARRVVPIPLVRPSWSDAGMPPAVSSFGIEKTFNNDARVLPMSPV